MLGGDIYKLQIQSVSTSSFPFPSPSHPELSSTLRSTCPSARTDIVSHRYCSRPRIGRRPSTSHRYAAAICKPFQTRAEYQLSVFRSMRTSTRSGYTRLAPPGRGRTREYRSRTLTADIRVWIMFAKYEDGNPPEYAPAQRYAIGVSQARMTPCRGR